MGLFSSFFKKSAIKIKGDSFRYMFDLNSKEHQHHSNEIVQNAKLKIWANLHNKPEIRVYLHGYTGGEGLLSVHRDKSIYKWLMEDKDNYLYDFKLEHVNNGKMQIALYRKLIERRPKKSVNDIVESEIKKFAKRSSYRDLDIGYVSIYSPFELKKRTDDKHLQLEQIKEISEDSLKSFFEKSNDPHDTHEHYLTEFYNEHFKIQYKGESAGKIDFMHTGTLVKLAKCFRDYKYKKTLVYDSDKGEYNDDGMYASNKLTKYDDGFKIYLHVRFEK